MGNRHAALACVSGRFYLKHLELDDAAGGLHIGDVSDVLADQRAAEENLENVPVEEEGEDSSDKVKAYRCEHQGLFADTLAEFSCDGDYRKYIPDTAGENFSVKEFAKAAKIREDRARAVIKVFEARGVLVNTGKTGRSFRYSQT